MKSALVLGAGSRGRAYADYSLSHPDELRIVAVAEPDESRREAFRKRYGLEAGNCFCDWREALSKGRIADCVFICTPASQAGSLTSGYYGFIGVGLGEAGSSEATFIASTVSSTASAGRATYPEIASGGSIGARADIAVNITAFPLSGEPDSNFIDSLDA